MQAERVASHPQRAVSQEAAFSFSRASDLAAGARIAPRRWNDPGEARRPPAAILDGLADLQPTQAKNLHSSKIIFVRHSASRRLMSLRPPPASLSTQTT